MSNTHAWVRNSTPPQEHWKKELSWCQNKNKTSLVTSEVVILTTSRLLPQVPKKRRCKTAGFVVLFSLSLKWAKASLQWRHNGRDGISHHQLHDCLLNGLFRRISKKTSKLRVTGLCAGNSPVTGEFPAQKFSYAENASSWWRHHELRRDEMWKRCHTIAITRTYIRCMWIIYYLEIVCFRWRSGNQSIKRRLKVNWYPFPLSSVKIWI